MLYSPELLRRFLSGFLVCSLLIMTPLSAWSDSHKTYLPILMKNFTAGTWATLLGEDFEGAFPGTAWELIGKNNFLWSPRNCRVHGGQYRGWGVGGGTAGTLLACGSHYPDGADAWMISKNPVDLTGATGAALTFYLWQDSDTTFDTDTVCRFVSTDNVDFWGTCSYGSTGCWTKVTLDLKNVTHLGDISSAHQVWVAVIFHSNGSTTLPEGAYVDDLLFRKCVNGGCAVSDEAMADPVSRLSLMEVPAYLRRPGRQ